jgi:STE24 endopeptidase
MRRLTGLGATRRIILADTLLDNLHRGRESRRCWPTNWGIMFISHISERVFFVQAAITFVGFWAANFTLHYAIDQHMVPHLDVDFANLPLLALVSVVLSFLLMPALNAYSRFNERQADRYAFESIASVEPFISSMNKLAEQNLAERSPSKWVEWFFHSHPAISRRLAAAEAWSRTQHVHPQL